MAENEQLKYWPEFLFSREKKVSPISPMTFLVHTLCAGEYPWFNKGVCSIHKFYVRVTNN